jgi:tRNA-specific 2-thiouridylase
MSKGRIAMALSGGVDSSVAALLLKQAGYDVIGVYMHLWDFADLGYQARQAEHLCSTLNIPFDIIDLQGEFEHYVVDYFCQEYRQGRTPNPCIACNHYIKFGFLLDKALSLDADYLATGHYARIETSNDGYHLLKAADGSKDQSYFLYNLSQKKLEHILFPLGSHSKAEVRQIGKRAELPFVAKASQDLCFISQRNYRAFLSQRFTNMPGDVVDAQGAILGHHHGSAFYTIGQRHGLGLASGEPLYVIRIEPEYNRIVMGSEAELYSQKVIAKNLNWIAGELPSEAVTITAKIRYKSREAEATVFPIRHCERGEAISEVWFSQPQRAVTPGQAIVFYNGNEVLGGGTIGEILNPKKSEDLEFV